MHCKFGRNINNNYNISENATCILGLSSSSSFKTTWPQLDIPRTSLTMSFRHAKWPWVPRVHWSTFCFNFVSIVRGRCEVSRIVRLKKADADSQRTGADREPEAVACSRTHETPSVERSLLLLLERVVQVNDRQWEYSRLGASLRRSNQTLVESQSTPALGHCLASSTSTLSRRYCRHPRPMPTLWECSSRYWRPALRSPRIAANRDDRDIGQTGIKRRRGIWFSNDDVLK